MADNSNEYAHIKHKIRNLKRLELRIRFNGSPPQGALFVWDSFFDLRTPGSGKAKYSLSQLSTMNKEEYKAVVGEFFFHVYFRYYRENGIVSAQLYDPEVLAQLGLPYNADYTAIRSKFHELALKHHPDTGGDAARFIELMKNYRKLIEKGK